ncbi:MAG: hypothetical protein F6J92_38720 [Symploca sp. SIO1A3]|nr:hypothetical protein [Symploca sp. SIO1A3]
MSSSKPIGAGNPLQPAPTDHHRKFTFSCIMLLAELTQSLQSQYAQIQIQIENLERQQREIQEKLQDVRSVESKMESAAALVAEAVAEITEVCPEELNSYQETINSLFTAPTAQLPLSDDSENSVEPPVEPELPNGNGNGHHHDVQDVGDFEVTIDLEPENSNGNGIAGIPTQDLIEMIRTEEVPEVILSLDELNQLSIQKIRKLASAKEVSAKGKRWEIAKRIEGLVTEDDVVALK